jgi:hypothetical protein
MYESSLITIIEGLSRSFSLVGNEVSKTTSNLVATGLETRVVTLRGREPSKC